MFGSKNSAVRALMADQESSKTGVFLRDTGERDEHGMQLLEDLLSSPQKAPTPAPLRNEEDSGSEDMELESSKHTLSIPQQLEGTN